MRLSDGVESAFRCTEIRRRGPTALPAREYRVPCAIHAAMDQADAAWRDELRAVTLADLVQLVAEHAPRAVIVKGIDWFQEVLR